ncbi:transglycosylase SLT domain-containing protein [Tabrizicola sp.]|uniref:transglycosylase SLT domain-containing protein n=1 Tax=Tabrizicola sp. TaxID=2005166 RepID=UPI0027367657|nr:transglycosylase SLT domain-containing protein [Tabrizicola sp.]MDP3193990.1 transglycosylase SLT domain-containing protein [Tabrizicola sp.]
MPRRRMTLTTTTAALALLLSAVLALGGEDPSDLCLRAASDAAARTGVPYSVLRAISMVETGREGRPWPWTVNFGGDGRWFDSAVEAEEEAAAALEQGATNVDLGCFQLNYRWHAQGFASVSDMLDPEKNALYAAEFLADHFAQTGDWAVAAAAYHSATPEFATAYQAKFEAAYAKLEGSVPDVQDTGRDLSERENRFPLLVAGSTGSGGSLVPAGPGGLRLIGAP